MSFGAIFACSLCLAFIVYTYVLYPLAVVALSRVRHRPVRRAQIRPRVSIIVPCRNEEANVGRRVRNLLEIEYPADLLELILVSDGSTDRTVEVARQVGGERLRVIELPAPAGKASALGAGVEVATGDVLFFGDARQTFAPAAVARLVENFADAAVGAASGELILEGADRSSMATGLSAYWSYEKVVRRAEGDLGSTVGVTGAIWAMRRALWRPLPAGTTLDDLVTPLRIIVDGFRVVFDGRALAFDQATSRAAREFGRKVRTLAGNFEALAIVPQALLPWRSPVAWQLVSHKLCRLLVPFALIVLLIASLLDPSLFGRLLLGAQFALYSLPVMNALLARRLRIGGVVELFLIGNAAALTAFVMFLRGGRIKWTPTVET